MPLYDYRCTECKREVEVMHGIHDDGPSTCPHCGGAMRKALSTPAIHFKGSGWAKKDAAASAKKATSKPDTKTESGSADEAKPAGGEAKSSETKSSDASTSESSSTSSSQSENKSTSTTKGSPSD